MDVSATGSFCRVSAATTRYLPQLNRGWCSAPPAEVTRRCDSEDPTATFNLACPPAVAAIWPNDPDGNAWGDPKLGFPPPLKKPGYTIIDRAGAWAGAILRPRICSTTSLSAVFGSSTSMCDRQAT